MGRITYVSITNTDNGSSITWDNGNVTGSLRINAFDILDITVRGDKDQDIPSFIAVRLGEIRVDGSVSTNDDLVLFLPTQSINFEVRGQMGTPNQQYSTISIALAWEHHRSGSEVHGSAKYVVQLPIESYTLGQGLSIFSNNMLLKSATNLTLNQTYPLPSTEPIDYYLYADSSGYVRFGDTIRFIYSSAVSGNVRVDQLFDYGGGSFSSISEDWYPISIGKDQTLDITLKPSKPAGAYTAPNTISFYTISWKLYDSTFIRLRFLGERRLRAEFVIDDYCKII